MNAGRLGKNLFDLWTLLFLTVEFHKASFTIRTIYLRVGTWKSF